MKKVILVLLVVLLASAAFAADASTTVKFAMKLNQATTFAGVRLPVGDYKVFVDRTGDSAKVRINDGAKDVVNTTAKYQQIEKLQTELTLSLDGSRNVQVLQSNKIQGSLTFDGSTVPPANGGR